ncbi:MAG: hypothetical protein KKA79_03240 [Nanoarchaeota archaeon]|nr:hypothetical protein [Nanoarchaeota archaeon]MCG2718756.1 hypothetical protein [Nanoarchaeota archaeon]
MGKDISCYLSRHQGRGAFVGLASRLKSAEEVVEVMTAIGKQYMETHRGFNMRNVEEHKDAYARQIYEAIEGIKTIPEEIKDKFKSYAKIY